LVKKTVGNGTLTLNGNLGTPANVVISTTSASAITVSGPVSLNVTNLKLQTTTSGSCLVASNGGAITYTNLVFGAAAGGFHILSSNCSTITALTTGSSITGGSQAHIWAQTGATINTAALTHTLTGTLSFTSAFAAATSLGVISSSGGTFSGGTITGTRYNVNLNSVINTNGGGANFYPGSVAGSTATGGQYA
jgi:hypothetical protein